MLEQPCVVIYARTRVKPFCFKQRHLVDALPSAFSWFRSGDDKVRKLQSSFPPTIVRDTDGARIQLYLTRVYFLS